MEYYEVKGERLHNPARRASKPWKAFQPSFKGDAGFFKNFLLAKTLNDSISTPASS
jgi:hypothetical protein